MSFMKGLPSRELYLFSSIKDYFFSFIKLLRNWLPSLITLELWSPLKIFWFEKMRGFDSELCESFLIIKGLFFKFSLMKSILDAGGMFMMIILLFWFSDFFLNGLFWSYFGLSLIGLSFLRWEYCFLGDYLMSIFFLIIS